MSKKRRHKPLIQVAQDLREAITALLEHLECPDSFTRRLSALHDDLEPLTAVQNSSQAQAQESFYETLTGIIVGNDKKAELENDFARQ